MYAGLHSSLDGFRETESLSQQRRHVDHTDVIHNGQFTTKTELAAANRADLEMLGVPKGAAGAIVKAAGSTGDFGCLYLLKFSLDLHVLRLFLYS